ncbi:MAG TPA: 6-phospho-3-hexuloisomerase [Thermodesulfobacteriota bacterium]|nr:6-phospho-3-hexuloisomerase [Thermodesulfobacteriota bacterium]
MFRLHLQKEPNIADSVSERDISWALDQIIGEVGSVMRRISPEGAESFIRELEKANRIFCFGAGRSGFVLRTFCMRLMQLGFTVYYVGETITPRIQPNDLLIAISGSGETGHTCGLVKQAHNRQARTVALTAHQDSAIGQLADLTLTIPGATKLTLAQEEDSHQCPGSLFEQAAFLFLEAVVMQLFHLRLGRDREQMLARHADLE